MTIYCTVRDNSRVVEYGENMRRRAKLVVQCSTWHGSFIMFPEWQIFIFGQNPHNTNIDHQWTFYIFFNCIHCISPSFSCSFSHLFVVASSTAPATLPVFSFSFPRLSSPLHSRSCYFTCTLFCGRLVALLLSSPSCFFIFFSFPPLSSDFFSFVFSLLSSPPLSLVPVLSPLMLSALLPFCIFFSLLSFPLLLCRSFRLFLCSPFLSYFASPFLSHFNLYTYSSYFFFSHLPLLLSLHVVSHLECFEFLCSYSFSLLADSLPVYILLFLRFVPLCFTHSPSPLFFMASPTLYTLEEQHIHTR